MAISLESLEQRITKLELFVYEIIGKKFDEIDRRLEHIDKRLSDLYEKTESDKTEIHKNVGSTKTELYEKIESTKTELYEKFDNLKVSLIKWMVGLFIAFTTLIITAVWAILSFAIK